MSNDILSSDAKLFLDSLAATFGQRIEKLLLDRKQRSTDPSCLGFLEETKHIREGHWNCSPPPLDILDRCVEITGPPTRKMVINALNSGAKVYMADFEDSNCPVFQNCIEGQINLRDAVKKKIEYTDPKTSKNYTLLDHTAVLFVRPRGLHLTEKNYVVAGNPIAASLFDYGLYFFHNYEKLLESNTRPYFYLPKIEHYKEAELWDDIFSFTEKAFDLPIGTIRATVLIETLPAAFQMDEILYSLSGHSAGLNCGRWDYIFSFIKTMRDSKQHVLPDRDEVGMNQHFMNCYSQLLIQTCHKRGVHAMGGMAAQIPVKDDLHANQAAFWKVMQDKMREAKAGHDGTWVAHPGLIGTAMECFDLYMEKSNQIDKKIYLNNPITREDLLCVPKGQCSEKALRNNICVGFQYLNAWLNGNGCVPINNLMEDAATAEISRTQIWQWIKHKIYLSNGKQVTKPFVLELITEELEQFKDCAKFEKTEELFIKLCTSNNLIDFLTTECYNELL